MTADRQVIDQPSYVVGIGASAGGLDALERFFDHMSPESGLAFVIVQHLSPNFKSLMDELLARHTQMKIRQAEDNMGIEANNLYLIPPRKNIILKEGKLRLTEQSPTGSLNLPIDVFFRSLAEDVGERAIAVILSGTGSDGSRGLVDIHQAKGLVLVQNRDTAMFDGMPRSAIATNVVDIVVRPEDMPARILSYVRQGGQLSAEERNAAYLVREENELSLVFGLLRKRFSIDFSQYKSNTVLRRIERRMSLANIRDVEGYLIRLLNDSAEMDSLYRDLLIEVTQFFRDAEVFKILRDTVLPELFAQTNSSATIRIWVPGCATGEEAYSFAILFDEFLRTHQKPIEVRIFATDVHQQSLDTAGKGLYRKESLAKLSEAQLKTYFTRVSGGYQVKKRLRQMIIFSRQDIIYDPPFTKIDLISCRNVLIYLKLSAQQKVLANFHFSLRVGGILLLGPSEQIGNLSQEFRVINSRWRIYRKRRDVRLPLLNVELPAQLGSPNKQETTQAPFQLSFKDVWMEKLLTTFVPSGLVVAESNELIYIYGDAGKYLHQPEGRVTTDVMKLTHGDLRMAVGAVLHQTKKDGKIVTYSGIRAETVEQEVETLKITIIPLTDQHQQSLFYFIGLEATLEREEGAVPLEQFEQFNPSEAGKAAELALKQELKHAEAYLRTTVEELEAANEELQAANEELMASNQELQSTNEELTAANQELFTVNTEYQRKIDELTQLTNDLQNLQNSSQIGVIFLDRQLQIRHFTPAVADMFNLLPQDIGRPLKHIVYYLDLEFDDLRKAARTVLAEGGDIEFETIIRAKTPYLLRILPYQTEVGATEGVVLTFTEQLNQELRRINASLEERVQKRTRLLEAANHSLARSNAALEQFAYAASHDLQEPLRTISNYVGLLQKKYANQLDERGALFLDFIVEATGRMKEMVIALLDYSRLHQKEVNFAQVDCSQLLSEVLVDLNDTIERNGAIINHDVAVTITANDVLLRQLFQNLITNAIKFRQPDALPEISITVREEPEQWLFKIADNGIGIDEKYFSEIFGIFRRLHTRDEYEGNGLGLTLCRKIVELHEGEIWLTSREEEGTTFYFTIGREL